MAKDKDATGRRTGGPEAQLRQKTKEREGRGDKGEGREGKEDKIGIHKAPPGMTERNIKTTMC